MSIADLIRSMSAAGAPAEAIALAVEAIEAAHGEVAAKRAVDRDRKRRQRDRSRDSHGTVTGQSEDLPLETKVSPTPPSKTQNPSPPSPPKGGSSPKLDADFERFWTAYPRKTGRGEARKAYGKAAGKIHGPDPPAMLLQALERVKATWTDAQYIPHAATWLNQERWEDEPETQIITLRQPNVRPDPDRPDAKRLAREANLARAFAGAQIAARHER